MILKTPITTKTPTPIAIPPTRTKAFAGPGIIVTCFETIMILGSAHVINKPKANENKTTIKTFFCLERDVPMYSPTLVNDEEAPIWNNAKPAINTTMPINTNQRLELDASVVILAKLEKCKIKIIAIIGTIESEEDINADKCLFLTMLNILKQ